MEFKDAVADQRSEHQKQIDALKSERDRMKQALGYISVSLGICSIEFLRELAIKALDPAQNVGGKT